MAGKSWCIATFKWYPEVRAEEEKKKGVRVWMMASGADFGMSVYISDDDDEDQEKQTKRNKGAESNVVPLLGDGGSDGENGGNVVAKKRKRAPKPKLTEQTLLDHEKGIDALYKAFESFKPQGRGHETKDLQRLLRKYADWAHAMFPAQSFAAMIDMLESNNVKKHPITIRMAAMRDAEYARVNGKPRPSTDGENDKESDQDQSSRRHNTYLIDSDDEGQDADVDDGIGTSSMSRSGVATLNNNTMAVDPERLARARKNREIAIAKRKQRMAELARQAQAKEDRESPQKFGQAESDDDMDADEDERKILQQMDRQQHEANEMFLPEEDELEEFSSQAPTQKVRVE